MGEAAKQIWIGGGGELAQDLRQVGWADLAGSARAVGKGSQLERRQRDHWCWYFTPDRVIIG
jgi:hypothetical protein